MVTQFSSGVEFKSEGYQMHISKCKTKSDVAKYITLTSPQLYLKQEKSTFSLFFHTNLLSSLSNEIFFHSASPGPNIWICSLSLWETLLYTALAYINIQSIPKKVWYTLLKVKQTTPFSYSVPLLWLWCKTES